MNEHYEIHHYFNLPDDRLCRCNHAFGMDVIQMKKIADAARDRFPNSDIAQTGFVAGARWASGEHYQRAADMLETLRDTIGHGYGEGDIEAITRIVKARLEDWDRLTWDNSGISYVLTEELCAAVEATKGRIVTIDVLKALHRHLNRNKQVAK